jgi:O-antigen/teichoic acid export membrane protein
LASIKKLASQTAYYGLSSILGRMLNYALVPLHTRVLLHQQDYGVVGELYSYVTFLNIIFLYGMETTFFRFASKSEDQQKTYNTIFSSVLFSSIALCGILFMASPTLLHWLSLGNDTSLYRIEYIYLFTAIMGIDAITAIPFAKLRLDNRPIKFAAVRIAVISINVFLNCYFLLFCPYWNGLHPTSIFTSFYVEANSVYYIFLSQFIATAATLLFLYKEIIQVKLRWVWSEMKPLLIFSLPLLFGGLAGMTNETLDRILLKYYLPGTMEERLSQIGIYNAAYKLSIFMTLAVQAFRMAAEPFFFSIHKNEDSKSVYAKVMNYFVLVCTIIFLGVVLHLGLFEYILGAGYRAGLGVVPILLFANLFLGIYMNLSIWYKVSDKTIYGAYITFIGAILTIVLNIILIPSIGYLGSAYATAICYIVMAAICYIAGQKFYHVPYQLNIVFKYIVLMLVFYGASIVLKNLIATSSLLINQTIDSALFILYVGYSYLQFNTLRKN